MPQDLVTTQRFEDHLKECNEKTSSISNTLKDIRGELKTFITQKDFQWMFGAYMTVILLVLGWIITMNYQFRTEFRESNKDISIKVERIKDTQGETNTTVGRIQEKVENLINAN